MANIWLFLNCLRGQRGNYLRKSFKLMNWFHYMNISKKLVPKPSGKMQIKDLRMERESILLVFINKAYKQSIRLCQGRPTISTQDFGLQTSVKMQVRKCELTSSGAATDLPKLKRQLDTLSRTKNDTWKQQRMNFLLILKCKYDLSFQRRPPAAFVWLSWHSNLWHGDELQLPVLLTVLTSIITL